MKNMFIICLLSMLLTQTAVHAQRVIKIYKNLVLLDLKPSDGYYADDEIPLYRANVLGEPIKVGRIKIIKFQNDQCAAKIIKQDKNLPIQKGDFILQKNMDTNFEVTSFDNTPGWLTYGFAGLGAVSIGLGAYYQELADKKYAEYATLEFDPETVEVYSRASSFENRSYVFYAVGGGLLTAAILHLLLQQKWENQKGYDELLFVPQILPQSEGFRVCMTVHLRK